MSFIQIWDVVEQGDIGCTRGGGRDAQAVFSGAGLLYASSASFKTPSRQGSYQFPSGMELFVVLYDVGPQKQVSLPPFFSNNNRLPGFTDVVRCPCTHRYTL